ncbi:MAG: hypothetical protein LBD85_06870 [Oscillospiraceae bacterium]|jgi:hypothetical protein|nr:hypothetical protein [Oscillospiraceae bacterium]
MVIQQVSVFAQNKKGAVADILRILTEADIQILFFSIADTEEYGFLHLLVDDTIKAERALVDNGKAAHITDVLRITLEHIPGAFYKELKKLSDAGINVEYAYGYVGEAGVAYGIVNVNDTGEAERALDV